MGDVYPAEMPAPAVGSNSLLSGCLRFWWIQYQRYTLRSSAVLSILNCFAFAAPTRGGPVRPRKTIGGRRKGSFLFVAPLRVPGRSGPGKPSLDEGNECSCSWCPNARRADQAQENRRLTKGMNVLVRGAPTRGGPVRPRKTVAGRRN
jgi:hypothetical protein